MLLGSSTSLTALFHGCKSFKITGMCSRRHGEVVLEKYDACRRQIYRPYQQKGTGAPPAQRVANQFLAASGKQISRKTVARRLRGRRTICTQTCSVCPIDRQHRTARLPLCREHHVD
ncbi:hypothetical protein TNCV_4028821 [Trichonephila clavipes]|nr:hypothetical protein TNCV_4028821 [Trichonephila clavipes]